MLPVKGWRKLSARGKRVVAGLALALVAGIAVAAPFVIRDREAGEAERARLAAQHRAAELAALREDQRPRHADLTPSDKRTIRAAGGLETQAAAALVGARLEATIASDVRARIAAGKLEGPLRGATCDPVRDRSARGANYNCFALTGRSRVGGRVLESGYRFSARAQLPAGTLAWCKENPRPLHPTSYVLSIPISPECR
jgi:hypothetical protein